MTDSNASFTLLIRLSNGQRMEVAVEGERGATLDGTSITVQKVKESIAKKDPSIPSDRQRLIFKGRILDNDRSLSDYDIVKGATLFLVKSAAPSTSAPAPAAASAAPAPYSATAANPNPNNSRGNAAGQPQMPPFMNPFGMPNAGGSGQQMPNPSPEQMQQMMNSPMMQGLLDNPDLLGSILEQQMHSNPQLQRLMEQNPELRQVYSDPAMLRQAAEMMRNPSHMQSMMRQQDLAMSQLENMPGGFAALSNMYHNVQEPMMEAQQAGRESESSNGTRNSGGTDGATGAAMPNPWGSPPSNANRSSGSSTTTSNRNSAAPAQQSNPFAAMMGGGGANPFAGAGEMANNPWAIGGGQSGENNAGMPGFPGMGMGGMPPPNMDQMQQMLENPAMSEMMRNMVDSNPDMIRSMLEAQNPMFAQMFGGNTEMANNFIRNMFNPENMRNMMQMQRNSGAMGGGGGGGMPFGMPPMGGNMGGGEGLDFSSLLQQFQNTGLGSAAAAGANAPPSNPADRYRNQLQQLYGMGFDDEQANLAALQAAHGNLNRAVDQLLSAPPAPSPAPAGNTNADTTSNSDSPSSAGSKDEAEKKND